ncbi:MAG TPA: hypothetical protein VLC72_00275 [Nitrosopumilaceae archaeon]|nr:hypothetical protein [Nitrosopumilaceae archaeon]
MLKICSICKKISASDDDHLDCIEKRRIELKAEDFKESIAEKLTIGESNDLHADIKGILEHLGKEKKKS